MNEEFFISPFLLKLDFLDKESEISSNSFLLGKYTSQIKTGTVLPGSQKQLQVICIPSWLTGSC